jgi:hypothetical protein
VELTCAANYSHQSTKGVPKIVNGSYHFLLYLWLFVCFFPSVYNIEMTFLKTKTFQTEFSSIFKVKLRCFFPGSQYCQWPAHIQAGSSVSFHTSFSLLFEVPPLWNVGDIAGRGGVFRKTALLMHLLKDLTRTAPEGLVPFVSVSDQVLRQGTESLGKRGEQPEEPLQPSLLIFPQQQPGMCSILNKVPVSMASLCHLVSSPWPRFSWIGFAVTYGKKGSSH